MLENRLGIILKKLREENGFTSQQALADCLGISQSTIGNWEAGTRRPNYNMILRLADLFGVSIDYLLGKEKPAGTTTDELSAEDVELWELFQAASPEKKAAIRALLK